MKNEEWKEYEMSELIDEISMGPFGSNIKVECFVDSGIPVLNGSNLVGFRLNEDSFNYVTEEKATSLGKANAYRGDIVITHRGTLGQIVYIPQNSKYERYVISQSQFRVRCSPKVLPEYLVYYFHSRLGQHKLLSNASQVGVPSLARPTSTFQKLTIEIPSIERQKEIVKILSALDDKIELNNAINRNLEEQAQEIFKNWFIDFEPFGGIMPSDWTIGKLSDIADITMGQSPDGKSYNEDGVGTVFYQGRAEFGWRFPTRRLFTTAPSRMAKMNDTLMSVRAPVGDLNIANEDCCIGRGLAAIHSKNNHQSFVHYTIVALKPKLDMYNGEGTVFGCINRDSLNNMEIVIPDKKTTEDFERNISILDAEIFNRSEENQKLISLRDSLLPKLMSGELSC
jgi:type I restriction enzyme S subunit